MRGFPAAALRHAQRLAPPSLHPRRWCSAVSRAPVAPAGPRRPRSWHRRAHLPCRNSHATMATPVVDTRNADDDTPERRHRPSGGGAAVAAAFAFNDSEAPKHAAAQDSDDDAGGADGAGPSSTVAGATDEPTVLRDGFHFGEWYEYRGRRMKHTFRVPVKLVWEPSKHVCVVAAADVPTGTVVVHECDLNEERLTVAEARERLQHLAPEERRIQLGHSWGDVDEAGNARVNFTHDTSAFLNHNGGRAGHGGCTLVPEGGAPGEPDTVWKTTRDVAAGEHLEIDYHGCFGTEPQEYLDLFVELLGEPQWEPPPPPPSPGRAAGEGV